MAPMDLDDLRGLTLWRPWAWSVAIGAKRIENRPIRPARELVGKRLAIHAGERWDDHAAAVLRAAGIEVPAKGHHYPGVILGLVTVRGSVSMYDVDSTGKLEGDALEDAKVRLLTVRGYAAEQAPLLFGPHGWLLSDAQPLATPVTCRGMQGLWRVPRDARDRVLAQV